MFEEIVLREHPFFNGIFVYLTLLKKEGTHQHDRKNDHENEHYVRTLFV